LRMPVPCDRTSLKNRSRTLDLDKNYNSSSHSDRRRCMHHDAKRAMVGIGVHRMNVSHLRNSQQRQQD